MNDEKLFFPTIKMGFVLSGVLLGTLTGCVGYIDGPRAGVYVAPPLVVEDDYVYYPDYEVYYSSSRHQYAYMEGSAWVSRPAPRGVSIDVLRSSRSVRMDFHDSPEQHHAEVVRQYPGNRAQHGGSDQGRKDNGKNDQRNQQGDNHGGNDGR
jgi:hypothetical protein